MGVHTQAVQLKIGFAAQKPGFAQNGQNLVFDPQTGVSKVHSECEVECKSTFYFTFFAKYSVCTFHSILLFILLYIPFRSAFAFHSISF